MNSSVQEIFCSPDSYTSSVLPIFEDPRRYMEYHCMPVDIMSSSGGLSEVHMEKMNDGTESTQINAPLSVSGHATITGIETQFSLPEVTNHECSVQLAGLPCSCLHEDSDGRSFEASVKLDHWIPKQETISSEPYMIMEWDHAESFHLPLQAVKTEDTPEFHPTLKDELPACNLAPRSARKSRRQRSEAECHRRSAITQNLHALQQILPESFKVKSGDMGSTFDNATAHIKYLQLQLKELSRTRLGGDLLSAPLNFLEGYGHYHPQDQGLEQPLEEVFGNLIKEDLAAAAGLLESIGLYMMPVTSIDMLRSEE